MATCPIALVDYIEYSRLCFAFQRGIALNTSTYYSVHPNTANTLMMKDQEEGTTEEPEKEEEEEEDLEKLQAEIEKMEAEAARITKENEDLEKGKPHSSAAASAAAGGKKEDPKDVAKRDG
jgi:hypothetical protein